MDKKMPHRMVNESPLVNPLAVILVKNGSKGDRLLFRYPFKKAQIIPDPSPSPRYNQTPSLRFYDSDFKTPASAFLQPSSAYPQKSSLSISKYPNTGSSLGLKSPLAKSSPISFGNLKNPQAVPTPVSSVKSVRIAEDEKDNSVGDNNNKINISPVSNVGSPVSIISTTAAAGNKLTPNIPSVTPISTHLLSSTKQSRIAWSEESTRIGLGNDILTDLSDKDLSNLLAVTPELTEKKFELKINEVRFVGHPTLMQHPNMKEFYSSTVKQQSTTIKLFHIVFCVQAMASHSIVKCFYDLSKRLGIALRHEEYRCNYLSGEIGKIVAMLDDASHHQESDLGIGSGVDHDNIMEDNYFTHLAAKILEQSSLAQLLKQVYDDVCQTGFVKLKINHWVQVSFCLPQKIHVLPYRNPPPIVEPENIHKCLEAIRPYHALLLLVDREELVGSFENDAASTIPRLLQVYSPLKSLQIIAADADLTLGHVVEIASHLVYWSMATIIYPICETNVYVVAPDAPISSELTEMDDAFLDRFPGLSLSQTLSDFSVPSQLGELINPVLGGSYVQSQVVQLVCWLLQHHLLIQLHTYVYMATYLDSAMNLESGNGNNSGQFLLDGNLSICPPYFEPEEDEITVSDSYSETTGDDIGLSPIPPSHQSQSSTLSASEKSESSTITLVGSHHTTSNEGDDVVDGMPLKRNLSLPLDTETDGIGMDNGLALVPMEKLKGTLDELADPVRRALSLVKQPISIHDIKVFSRISKYFNGEYHLEEIMYMENMRRSQVLLILDKFRDVLITVEKEDADINFFKTTALS